VTLRFEKDGPAGHLVIDRASQRNAFNHEMWAALPRILEQAAAERDLRLLIVRAADGGAFCAGADIKELLANKDDAEWRAANQKAINRAQFELARFALPTIAFVQGDCVGGGCGIALACDLRVAAPAARFGITPAKLGIVYPFHDVKLLVDLVGPGQAKRILFTGLLIGAEEALRIGLVEMLGDDLQMLTASILSASAHSNRENKLFVRRVLDGQSGEDCDTAGIFAAAFEGADFHEGAAAFVEKRVPDFG